MKTYTLKFLFTLFLLTGISSLCAESGFATAYEVSGEVTFLRPGDQNVYVLERGFELPVGSRIVTGADGVAVMKLTTGTAVRIAENTEVILMDVQEHQRKQKVRLKLNRGTLGSLLDPNRKNETDFRIQTAQGSAAARGTFYAVTVANGNTYVKVDEGVVEMFKPVE